MDSWYFSHKYYHYILSYPTATIPLRLMVIHPLVRDKCRKGYVPPLGSGCQTSIKRGIFDKIFKRYSKAGKSSERQDVYRVNTDDKTDSQELQDHFVDQEIFHNYWVQFENNNNNIILKTREELRSDPRVYPITPKFMVYEYVSPSKFGENQILTKKTETIQIIDLEDVYPQFLKPCMKLEDPEIVAGLSKETTRFKKLKSLFRCKSTEKIHVLSSEFRIDGFTTLHSLQGDTESDTGVPDPIRKLRHRRAGCY